MATYVEVAEALVTSGYLTEADLDAAADVLADALIVEAAEEVEAAAVDDPGSVVACDLASGRFGLCLIRQHVPCPGKRRGVRRVLLVASLHQHHPDIERERCDQEQGDEGTGEEDEYLPILSHLGGPASSC